LQKLENTGRGTGATVRGTPFDSSCLMLAALSVGNPLIALKYASHDDPAT